MGSSDPANAIDPDGEGAEPETRRDKPRVQKFHWLAPLIFLGFIALTMRNAWLMHGPEQGIGRASGVILVVLFFAWGLGTLAWYLSRRSTFIATSIFVMVTLLCGAASLVQMRMSSPAGVMDRIGAHLAKIPDTRAVTDRFLKSGGIDPKTLPDQAAIEDRIRLAAEARRQTLSQVTFLQDAPRHVDRIVADAKLDSDARGEVARLWRAKANHAAVLALREHQIKLLDLMIEALQFLRDNRWQLTDDGVLEFEDDASVQQFSDLMARLKTATEVEAERTKALRDSP